MSRWLWMADLCLNDVVSNFHTLPTKIYSSQAHGDPNVKSEQPNTAIMVAELSCAINEVRRERYEKLPGSGILSRESKLIPLH